MKKSLSMVLFLLVATPGVGFAKDKPCENITLTQIRKQVPVPPAKIISKQAVNGICEVILDIKGQYVPVFAGKDYVIAGEMFQKRRQVTQSKIDDLKAQRFVSLMPEINKCVAITVRASKKPTRVIYMITDPVCPFCHHAESQLTAFAKEHQTEFKILLYSVHPPIGTKKAIEAVCRKLSPADYLSDKWEKENKTEKYQCKKGKNLIFHTENIVSLLGVDSVPTFFLTDGHMITGADMKTLAEDVERKPIKNEKKAGVKISCSE